MTRLVSLGWDSWRIFGLMGSTMIVFTLWQGSLHLIEPAESFCSKTH